MNESIELTIIGVNFIKLRELYISSKYDY